MRRTRVPILAALGLCLLLPACDYFRLLRPTVLEQLDPDVVRLVNYLPDVDDPNEAMLGRLFAHGGLSHAERGADGVMRDVIRVPKDEFIWKPAVIVMDRPGEIELEFQNEDRHAHAAFLPHFADRQNLELPQHSAGRARFELDHPGLYWFGCPVGNHAGRGMLGVIIVEGEVPPEARLDRPRQPRPSR
jgi:PQQ system protein